MPVEAVQHVRRMRGGAQAHLMRADDGHFYVVKFQNLCGAPHKFCNVENSVMWSWFMAAARILVFVIFRSTFLRSIRSALLSAERRSDAKSSLPCQLSAVFIV